MELFGSPNVPDLSKDQRASNACIKLIKKLRWMGMNEEEQCLQSKLADRDFEPADSVVAEPRDTD